MARDISAEIERCSTARHDAWSAGDVATAKALDKKLEDLYEEKRTNAAANGSPKARAAAIRRAVVERELDRLMQA